MEGPIDLKFEFENMWSPIYYFLKLNINTKDEPTKKELK
jgi:hypothetical protein